MPGVVALVTDRKGVLYRGAFGVMDVESRRPMAVDSMFRIASMTKAVTSLALMQLIEQGKLGLEDPVELALESPFDYARQALAYLPRGLPEPSAPDYTERVVDAVVPVLEASRGRAFLLFTSHRALRRAAELLPARVPFPLFVQGSAPRNRLLEAFRASGNGVLLGAASFWEGVDVAGEALSVVVIDKLPFAAPDDPVLVARLDALREAGANPFADWQVPNAVIALKQGAGRLIRDVGDRGVLVLCDPRLTGRGYGKLFLASLPPLPMTRDPEVAHAFFHAGRPT